MKYAPAISTASAREKLGFAAGRHGIRPGPRTRHQITRRHQIGARIDSRRGPVTIWQHHRVLRQLGGCLLAVVRWLKPGCTPGGK